MPSASVTKTNNKFKISLKNRVKSISRKISGIAFLLIGMFFAGATLYFMALDLPLWLFGETVPATVEELWVENVSLPSDNELVFKYYLRYSFQDNNGNSIENSKAISDLEWSGQFPGNEIDIVYFPLIPSHNRLDDSRFVYFFLCMYIPLIAIGWFSIMGGLQILVLKSGTEKMDAWKNFYNRRFKKS